MLRGNPRKGKSTIQPETLSEDLPRVFHDLCYYLYSNSNIPRAERLGAEMVRIIFSKLDDELNGSANLIRIKKGRLLKITP